MASDSSADKAKDKASEAAKDAADAAKKKLGGVGDKAGGLGDKASGLGNTASGLGDKASGLGNTASGLGSTAADSAKGAVSGTAGKLGAAGAGIAGANRGAVQTATSRSATSRSATSGSVTSSKASKTTRWIDRGRNGKRWSRSTALALGLLPLLALLAYTLPRWLDHIEDDLEDATIVQMRERYGVELDKSQVDFDGRSGEITNFTLPLGVSNTEVENYLLDSLDGHSNSVLEGDIRSINVRGNEAAPAPTGSHDVDVVADGERITLNGDVLNQAEYDELDDAAVAAVGASNVTNNLNILDMEATKTGSAARVAGLAGAVALMTGDNIISGDARLTDDDLDVNAIATNDGAKSALEGSLAGVGGGVTVGGDVTVAAPDTGPIDVNVSTDGTSITLDGTVLSQAQHDALVSAAEAEVGAANVTNNLVISGLAEQAPDSDDKINDMAALFAGFDGLVEGSGSVTDGALNFTGVASDDAGKAAIEGLTGSANGTNNVDVSVAEATIEDEVGLLQAELDLLQAEILENVVFDVNSDVITPTAAGTLDKVVAAMNKYQRPKVRVGGHTDSDGDDAFNLDLSDRRAKSVAAYLGSQGIDTERLLGQGFGETEPVAANDTAENKQQNRRVEFTALAEFATN